MGHPTPEQIQAITQAAVAPAPTSASFALSAPYGCTVQGTLTGVQVTYPINQAQVVEQWLAELLSQFRAFKPSTEPRVQCPDCRGTLRLDSLGVPIPCLTCKGPGTVPQSTALQYLQTVELEKNRLALEQAPLKTVPVSEPPAFDTLPPQAGEEGFIGPLIGSPEQQAEAQRNTLLNDQARRIDALKYQSLKPGTITQSTTPITEEE